MGGLATKCIANKHNVVNFLINCANENRLFCVHCLHENKEYIFKCMILQHYYYFSDVMLGMHNNPNSISKIDGSFSSKVLELCGKNIAEIVEFINNNSFVTKLSYCPFIVRCNYHIYNYQRGSKNSQRFIIKYTRGRNRIYNRVLLEQCDSARDCKCNCNCNYYKNKTSSESHNSMFHCDDVKRTVIIIRFIAMYKYWLMQQVICDYDVNNLINAKILILQ